MRATIRSFVFFVILAWFNIAVPSVNADLFVVESTYSSLPGSAASSNFVIVSTGVNNKTCYAYRTITTTAVVFGFGSNSRQVSVSPELFTVAWSGTSLQSCLLFYIVKDDPATNIAVTNEDGTLATSIPFTGLPSESYTLSVIEDPTTATRFIVGISYAYNNDTVKYGTVYFNTDSLEFNDLDTNTPLMASLNAVKTGNLHQYGSAQNVSVVLQFASSPQIWAGNLMASGQSALFSPTDSLPAATGVVAMESRALSADSGVLCYKLASSVKCHQWVPSNSQINKTSFYEAPVDEVTTIALAQLNRDKSATALFGIGPLGLFVHHSQNGQTISDDVIVLQLENPVNYIAVTNADSSNRLTLLARDIGGKMHLVQIRHDLSPPTSSTPISAPFMVGIPEGRAPLESPTSNLSPGDTQTPQEVPISTLVPAIVIPIVVVAAGVIVLLLLLRRRKKRKGSLLHGKSRVEIAMESIDDRLKIPYKSLVFKKEIGAGSYGKVYVGEWKGTPVAIKVSSSVTDMDGFFDEARITVGLQQHPNVVQTFGVSLDGQLPCIVLEFCEGGSLDNRLFDSDVTMTQQQKVALIKGIARGLYHLHSNNIVHRDLAARNVLLNKSGTPKISDFGMSRVLKSEAEKGKTRTNYGPIRWMAPESLKDLQYSTKSDVWSFGIVLYEIVSRNEPHIDIDPLEVAVKIKNESYHPSIPQGVNSVLSELMLSCWQSEPNNRPSMEQICNKLNSAFPED